MTDHLFPTYARMPIHFSKGHGVWLTDSEGKQYLDALSGIGVCALGHTHPEITEAISKQASTLVHTANIAHIDQQTQLGNLLAEISGLDKAFFANSGAEANECAFKLARMHGHHNNIDVPKIVVFERAFHGRTLACLTASDNKKGQQGFEPLVEGYIRLPYGDIEAVKTLAEQRQDIAAVLIEPIQGEGGIIVPPEGFMQSLRSICTSNNWLMMMDEIQAGVGRTGKWYAIQHENVVPDVITTAKALGNGLPIGACIAKAQYADLMQPGTHGSTFGGNPLACAAALKTLQIMQRDKVSDEVQAKGQWLRTRLKKGLQNNVEVVEIRGRGLMIGIEMKSPAHAIKAKALDNGLIINVTRDKVIRLLPPLIISYDELETLADRLLAAFSLTPH